MNSNNKQIKLTDNISLTVYQNNSIIFQSSSKWLYPLFELEEFLELNNIDAGDCFLHDKIAGSAAAFLISGMGFKKCKIDLISKSACTVFERFGVIFEKDKTVEKIKCRTEDIIKAEMPADEVYSILKKRAGLHTGLKLNIENLSAGYGANLILKNINVKMNPGERLVITGDNGTGKTTLIKTLIGAVSLKSGNIVLKNNKNQIISNKSIGYITQLQEKNRFPISAEEVVKIGFANNKLPRSEMEHRCEIAMRRTNCFQYRRRTFHSLSGGEKQRVSLARCLCQKAGLIIMDEPTSFLDSESKEVLIRVLNSIVKSHAPTLLIVSHDHSWIEKLGWNSAELKEGCLCWNC